MKYFNIYANPRFKTGRQPSIKKQFDLSNLTPTQKLQLTSNRIFMTTIPDGFKSGRKAIRDTQFSSYNAAKSSILDYNDIIPRGSIYDNVEKRRILEDSFERRRQRILMRGVKLGVKRSSGSDNMGIFSQGKI